MTSTSVDRRGASSGDVAFKPPCRVATTAAITLSGLQTVDGVVLAANDRVLVKDQADNTTNGIYVVAASAWQRAPDVDGFRDIAQGTLVWITSGTVSANVFYQMTGTTSPFVIGTSAMTWARAPGNALIGMRVFTTPGTSTYTPTAGANTYVAEVIGGGGAGGSCILTGAANVSAGGGGAGGGYARKRGLISAISGATVTVGAAGAAAAAGNNAGGAGGTSSIGAVVTASGGAGGLGSGAAAGAPVLVQAVAGGTGASGDLNLQGERGGEVINFSNSVAFSGRGGSSMYGFGGHPAPTIGGSAGGQTGTGYGSGGSGGVNAASQAAGNVGGAGLAGLVIIWEYS